VNSLNSIEFLSEVWDTFDSRRKHERQVLHSARCIVSCLRCSLSGAVVRCCSDRDQPPNTPQPSLSVSSHSQNHATIHSLTQNHATKGSAGQDPASAVKPEAAPVCLFQIPSLCKLDGLFENGRFLWLLIGGCSTLEGIPADFILLKAWISARVTRGHALFGVLDNRPKRQVLGRLREFGQLCAVQRSSAVVYFSGHGNRQGHWRFQKGGCLSPRFAARALGLESERIFVVADCCHAAAAQAPKLTTTAVVRSVARPYCALLAAACMAKQFAYDTHYGGAFTRWLVGHAGAEVLRDGYGSIMVPLVFARSWSCGWASAAPRSQDPSALSKWAINNETKAAALAAKATLPTHLRKTKPKKRGRIGQHRKDRRRQIARQHNRDLKLTVSAC